LFSFGNYLWDLIFCAKGVKYGEHTAMEKRIRTGVIGLGKMGILHSALINMIPEA